MIDLSPAREPAGLVDAIWELRRREMRNRAPDVARLLIHHEPTVRSEALSLLAKWRTRECEPQFVLMLQTDGDIGVRARAALSVAAVNEGNLKSPAVQVLKEVVLNTSEDGHVRNSAYESLLWIAGRKREAPLARLPSDLSWVKSL